MTSRAAQERRTEREFREAKGIMALVVTAILLVAVGRAAEWHQKVAQLDAFPAMARMLFGEFIVPFEVLGFLLLAGLLGALYFAQQEAVRRG